MEKLRVFLLHRFPVCPNTLNLLFFIPLFSVFLLGTLGSFLLAAQEEDFNGRSANEYPISPPLESKAGDGYEGVKEEGGFIDPGEPSPSEDSSMRSMPDSFRLRIATYNVHKCRGLDGRTQPARVASVLKHLKPDIIALQEVVGSGQRGRGQEQEISEKLGMDSVMAPARVFRGHSYGNALLSRFPIQNQVLFDLSQEGLEPRFCQRVDILVKGHPVHFYNVHLGTSRTERARQAKKLVPFLSDPSLAGPKILLGDFNEWIKGPATKTLCNKFQSLDLLPFLTWPKTYPGIFPVLHIDHIYYQGRVKVLNVEAPRTWLTMISSDHMPIVAELKVRADRSDSK